MRKIRLNSFLDHISIRNKWILTYIVCIFIPIVVILYMFYVNISESIFYNHNQMLKASGNTIKMDIASSITQCINVSTMLYTNKEIDGIANTQYKPGNEFANVTASRKVNTEIDNFCNVYGQIESVEIYHTNHLFMNGTNFIQITPQILRSAWYKGYTKSNNEIYLYPNVKNNNVIISLIRKLNYFSPYIYNKVLKIDINTQTLLYLIESHGITGDMYLVDNNNNVICSTRNAFYLPELNKYNIKNYIKNDSNLLITTNYFGNASYFRGWRLISVMPKTSMLKSIDKARFNIFLMAIVCIILSGAITTLISHSVTFRLKLLCHHMKVIENNELTLLNYNGGNDEIGQTMQIFDKMATTINSLINEVYKNEINKTKLESSKLRAELNALQSQINPHFLFNILNTIRIKCLLKNETETAQILKSMSSMFRTITHWNNDMIPVKEEIDFIEQYLEIQKYRLEDRINYSIDADDSISNALIAKMSIQPLIENACTYGIENTHVPGMINVSIRRNDDRLLITVKDNGAGLNEDALNKLLNDIFSMEMSNNNLALKNVYIRLSMLYKNNFQFNIKSKVNEGFEVNIEIPLSY